MSQSLRKLVCLTVVVLAVVAFRPAAAQDSLRIVALVNDDIITAIDLGVRTQMIIATSGLQDTPEMRQRLKPQVLRVLIDDRLRQQAADKDGISVSQDRIDERMTQMAQNNNLTLDQFRDALLGTGIDPTWLEDQVRTEIAWGMLVNRKYRPTIVITEADVDNAERRLRESLGQTEYRVAEIFLSIDDPNDTEAVRESAQRLIDQLKEGVDFAEIARQFSQASTAANGGVIGWVRSGDLSPELATAVQSIEPGTIAGPVRSEGGFHIVRLIDRRDVTADSGQTREEITNRLGRERLDQLARGYLRELRRTAFVDVRQ